MEKTSGGDNVGGQNVGEKTSVDKMSGDQIFKINVFFSFFFKNLQFFWGNTKISTFKCWVTRF